MDRAILSIVYSMWSRYIARRQLICRSNKSPDPYCQDTRWLRTLLHPPAIRRQAVLMHLLSAAFSKSAVRYSVSTWEKILARARQWESVCLLSFCLSRLLLVASVTVQTRAQSRALNLERWMYSDLWIQVLQLVRCSAYQMQNWDLRLQSTNTSPNTSLSTSSVSRPCVPWLH